ncbi:MAG: hypothetical protein LBP34_08630 [Flavobacteriaceae bacterium]|jgi:seryl-tRNA(Sec) selenium transferase|nr:hypothetical protein [Flavobacteriaceae bacterium]
MATLTKKETSVKSIRLQNDFLSFLEKKANKENRNLTNYIVTVLMSATGYGMPNKETLDAMSEVKNNPENLTKVDNVSDYFEKFKHEKI